MPPPFLPPSFQFPLLLSCLFLASYFKLSPLCWWSPCAPPPLPHLSFKIFLFFSPGSPVFISREEAMKYLRLCCCWGLNLDETEPPPSPVCVCVCIDMRPTHRSDCSTPSFCSRADNLHLSHSGSAKSMRHSGIKRLYVSASLIDYCKFPSERSWSYLN